MKTYFRLLSFAKPIEKFAIPYILCVILWVIFGTLNFALLTPLFDALFNDKTNEAVITHLPNFSLSIDYFKKAFFYYIHQVSVEHGEGDPIKGKIAALKYICIIIVTSVLLSNLFKYMASRIMENLRLHTLLRLRNKVFDNVMNLQLGYFSNERKGDILSKISSDVQVVQYTVTGSLQVVFQEPLLLISYTATLFYISSKLTFFALLVIPVSGIIISQIVKRLKHQATTAQESYGLMISYLDEALSSIRVIKAFNALGFIKNRFNNENKRYSMIARSMSKRQQLASPVSETLGVITLAGILLYGGSLVINKEGSLSASQFIAYLALFSQVTRPVKALTNGFSGIHSGIAAGERVLALIDTKPTIFNKPNAKEITSFEKEVTFNDVSFAYKDIDILKNVSFSIPKGKTIALVGPSGGGKSTISDLIPRFYDVKSGSITFDGTDVRDVTMESLRSQMGVVNQESLLINDSIFNNIAFGKPHATQEQVEHAAKIANAHNFIMSTESGYHTNIGDRGNKLSGGQKQRICIARAVLANPPIMLLDEATSALDTESEKLVQEALNRLMEHRTTLIVAHRLSTIQNADNIIVIEGGSIIESGTHNELMNNGGLYQRLINMQNFSN